MTTGFRRLLRGTEAAPWDVRAGVEQVTVTGAEPGQPLTLYGQRGRQKLLTLLADDQGQAHFAYLPPEHATVAVGPDLDLGGRSTRSHGTTVEPGRYAVVDDSASPAPRQRGRHRSRAATTCPTTALYDGQDADRRPARHPRQPQAGLGHRRGASSTSRCATACGSAPWCASPTTALYGPGPYPTVVEYSGYGPSNPAQRGGRASASPGPSATPRCRSTCAAPAARAACSTCSTPPRWPTATTRSRSSPARPGC